jgi:elongator complex protein 3
MRHLGGTFSTYSTIYKYEYTRDMFYAVNVLHLIIDNEELYNKAKLGLKTVFDPNDSIMSNIRKPFNYEKLEAIKNEIEDCKKTMPSDIENMLDKQYKINEIKFLEETYLIELKKSLLQEQIYNITNKHRVVSFSIETRPDNINFYIIQELFQLGVTIVELGLQSTNDTILKINKRGHNSDKSKKAIRMLKDNGFHVHGQWMMDLPGSTKEIDAEVIKNILSDDFRCDQIKIYPHLSMPGTETKKWLDQGKYTSWVSADKQGFEDVLIDFITNIDETTRIVRIQRDLPQKSEITPNGYTNDQPSNLEELITKKIYKLGKTREDIRYHEPGLRFVDMNDLKYYIDIKELNGGTDIFISAQSYVCNDINRNVADFRIVWGYCRLRIVKNNDNSIEFFNKHKYGRIRELKVNGSTQTIGSKGTSVQHKGIGSNMLKIAEEMAFSYGMTHVTVTSAVGVRDYYRLKHGYQLDNCGLMWKKLDDNIKLRKLVRVSKKSGTKYEILMNEYQKKDNKIFKICLISGVLSIFGVSIYVYYKRR